MLAGIMSFSQMARWAALGELASWLLGQDMYRYWRQRLMVHDGSCL